VADPEFSQKSIFRYDGRKSRTCYGEVGDVVASPRLVAGKTRGSPRQDTWKSPTSPTSPCLVGGMYGDVTGLSRTCHGEVGVMEFGL